MENIQKYMHIAIYLYFYYPAISFLVLCTESLKNAYDTYKSYKKR